MTCFPRLAALALVLACSPTWGQSIRTNEVASAQPPSKRQLIVHIDDAGMCHAANVATIKSLESGASSSASVMMPCGWVGEFADFARKNPQYCYGVHFTLNAEFSSYRWAPVAGRNRVPSLVDDQGFMWASKDKAVEHMKAEEVEIELRAQIELAQQMGIPISHFDTHIGTVLARPDLVAIYIKLAYEYDKPVLWLRKLDEEQRRGYPDLAAAAERVVAEMNRRKLPVLDSLLQFYGGDDLAQREQIYRDALKNLQPGVTQLIIHSAVDGQELAAITSSHLRRNQDFELFSPPAMKHWIEDQGIELTNWKRLTEQARR